LKAVIALGNPAITQKAFERLQTLGVAPGKPARIPWYRGQRPIGGTTTRNLSTEGQVPDYVQKRIDEDRAAASVPRPSREVSARDSATPSAANNPWILIEQNPWIDDLPKKYRPAARRLVLDGKTEAEIRKSLKARGLE
jgi:hypothetical protein